MSNDKKYNIITSIDDDAPATGVNWCSISFLTPQKMEKTKYLDAKGFKIHNGYNTFELASEDVKKIKEKNKNHDIYVSQIGKIYAWDDATKTDVVEYDNEKLNDLEKTRRENLDKIKLMKEQFKNEYKTLYADGNKNRLVEARKSVQKKLYERGLITKKEYEIMQEDNSKSSKEIKEIVTSLEKIKEEMDEAYKIDYLDENDPVALKYGCLTIYSPKQIGGLKTLLFKVRGLFQTQNELNKRIKKLQNLYPNDRIYQFEIGKWYVISEKDNIESTNLLKQLNYTMKCYLENLEKETDEFEKRKETLKEKTEQESKMVKNENRKQKGKQNMDQTIDTKEEKLSIGNETDNEAIQKIINFLDDPELRNKFPSNQDTQETIEMDINKI